MLETLTKDTFAEHQGEVFRLTEVSGEGSEATTEPVELTLRKVGGTGLQGRADREQFSLHFDGPREPLLPQKIYHLENDGMGALDLFLVPVAQDDEGTTYEAVFT